MKKRTFIFLGILSLLIVSLGVTIIFFVKDLKKEESVPSNNAEPPSVFSIDELSLALFKNNYRLPLDEDYTYTFEYDESILFMEDGYICPFNPGSTYIFIKAKFEDQTFLHTIALSIYDITSPTFSVVEQDDNTFILSIDNCPALNVANIITNPRLNFTNNATKKNNKYTQAFKTDVVSTPFSISYSINLDNYSETIIKELTATQSYIANITHTDVYILDSNHKIEANNAGFFGESEFILTKDYNLPNFKTELIVENPEVIEKNEDKLYPLKPGSTKVYVLLDGKEIFSELITVKVVEAEQVEIEPEQNVGKSFTIKITPCYASTIIKYDSYYLSYTNSSFLPLKTGNTTITVYSGNKTIKKDITISFSQTSVDAIISENKNVKTYTIEKDVNTWFTLNIVNQTNSTFSANQKFSIYVNCSCYESNYDFAPSYDFKFSQTGTYYIVAINQNQVYAIYKLTIK